MKPEEFEVYVIPPNFMEGGTLFGGLLKTRNTIEAVILGLAVGVPVLHLPFSLTVRVVILCLTALPLVLLALIGVSGMSLSAFIRLFFCFLHNRRILSRDGTQGGKNGKTLLPSWAQQRKSDCEAEDPPLPKSRSRFSVDLKQRSVTQFRPSCRRKKPFSRSMLWRTISLSRRLSTASFIQEITAMSRL